MVGVVIGLMPLSSALADGHGFRFHNPRHFFGQDQFFFQQEDQFVFQDPFFFRDDFRFHNPRNFFFQDPFFFNNCPNCLH